MSLGIIIKGPEGVVLAADSRVTLTAQASVETSPIHVNYDNATKLLSFQAPNNYVGAVTYGQAAIGLRTASSFLPELEAQLPDERLSVEDFSTRLSQFFVDQWKNVMPDNYNGPPMIFVVGGFDPEAPYGRMFLFEIPNNPQPQERSPRDFGMTWGGQREIVDRLIQGFDNRLIDLLLRHFDAPPDPEMVRSIRDSLIKELQLNVPIQAMALQDCVDLAVFFLQTTISGQSLTVGIRGVGGPVDVAVITRRDGFKYIQKKQIVAK